MVEATSNITIPTSQNLARELLNLEDGFKRPYFNHDSRLVDKIYDFTDQRKQLNPDQLRNFIFKVKGETHVHPIDQVLYYFAAGHPELPVEEADVPATRELFVGAAQEEVDRTKQYSIDEFNGMQRWKSDSARSRARVRSSFLVALIEGLQKEI